MQYLFRKLFASLLQQIRGMDSPPGESFMQLDSNGHAQLKRGERLESPFDRQRNRFHL